MNSQLLGSPSSTANHPSLLFPPPESLPPHKKHHPNGSAPRAIRLGNTDGTSPALNALLGLLIQLLHPGDESLHNPTAHGAEQHMTGGIQLAVLAPEDGLVGPNAIVGAILRFSEGSGYARLKQSGGLRRTEDRRPDGKPSEM